MSVERRRKRVLLAVTLVVAVATLAAQVAELFEEAELWASACTRVRSSPATWAPSAG